MLAHHSGRAQGPVDTTGRLRNDMASPIKLISTDFDGTIFAEFENPPIPQALQELIGDLQVHGAKWVISRNFS